MNKPESKKDKKERALWTLNPVSIQKVNKKLKYYSQNNSMSIKKAMAVPESLDSLEAGKMKKDYNTNNDSEGEDDLTSVTNQIHQGYDSADVKFVDTKGFSPITLDPILPEIQSGGSSKIHNDLVPSDKLIEYVYEDKIRSVPAKSVHTCHLCNKKFIKQIYLKLHMKRVHEGKKFSGLSKPVTQLTKCKNLKIILTRIDESMIKLENNQKHQNTSNLENPVVISPFESEKHDIKLEICEELDIKEELVDITYCKGL